MKRSVLERKPAAVQDLLERAIEREGFANYAGLAKEFSKFGRGFSKSGIHRFAVKLEQRKARARHEAEMLGHLGDDVAWFIKWARGYPAEASAVVRRLKSRLIKEQEKMK